MQHGYTNIEALASYSFDATLDLWVYHTVVFYSFSAVILQLTRLERERIPDYRLRYGCWLANRFLFVNGRFPAFLSLP
jgi:hypothetical protein